MGATEVDVMDKIVDTERRTRIGLGILLIAVGAIFLVGRQLDLDWRSIGWPIFVIGGGLALFVLAIAVGSKPGAGFAVPAGIVTMTGLVLAVQNATGLWATWAYAWALVAPGGVGVGLVLYGVLTRQRELARGGLAPLLTGAGLFVGFAAFFELFVGLSGLQIEGGDTILAVGVIALGVILLVVGATRRRPA